MGAPPGLPTTDYSPPPCSSPVQGEEWLVFDTMSQTRQNRQRFFRPPTLRLVSPAQGKLGDLLLPQPHPDVIPCHLQVLERLGGPAGGLDRPSYHGEEVLGLAAHRRQAGQVGAGQLGRLTVSRAFDYGMILPDRPGSYGPQQQLSNQALYNR